MQSKWVLSFLFIIVITLSSCYYEEPPSLRDPSPTIESCEDIDTSPSGGESKKLDCYVNEAIAQKNPKLCNSAKHRRAECLGVVASLTSNLALCDHLSKEESYECYENLAIGQNNTQICDDFVKNTDTKNSLDDCYFFIAIHLQDPTICEEYFNSSEVGSCFHGIALQQNNATLCMKISPGEIRDGCNSDIALESGNSSICSLISNNNTREVCYLNFNEATN